MKYLKKLGILCMAICMMLPMFKVQPSKASELKGSTRAEQLYNYFYEKGYTPQAAAGIVGNVMWESSGGHGSFNFPLHTVEAATGEGIGMCQWSFGRKQNFIKYCESKGVSWKKSTLKMQADFLEKELSSGKYWLFPPHVYSSAVTPYKMSYSQFKNQTDVTKAVGGFCFNFERPSEYYAHFSERITYAKRVLKAYQKTLSAPTNISLKVEKDDVQLNWTKGQASTKTKVEIYDVNDKQIKTHTTKNNHYKVKDLNNGIYYIRIGAMTPRNEIEYSRYYIVSIGTSSQQAKVMATNLQTKTIDYNTLEVKWTKVENAEKYLVYRSINGGAFKEYKTLTTNSFQMDNAQTGVTYAFKVKTWVKTKYGVLDSPVSSVVSGKTSLNDKVELKIESVGNTKFKLSWNKVSGATAYCLYISDESGSYQKTKVLDDDELSYTTNVLTPETYSFKVQAARYSGTKRVYGAMSNTLTGKSVFAKANIAVTKKTSTSLQIQWEKVDGVPYYSVYRKVNADGTYKKITSGDPTTIVDKGLENNNTYYYRVKGYRIVGDKKYYSPVSNEVKYSL